MTSHLPILVFRGPLKALVDVDGNDSRTPCQRDPQRWDTDHSYVDKIRGAARDCLARCPLLEACRARVDHLTRSSVGLRGGAVAELAGMVWAGRAYSQGGTLLDLNDPAVRTGPCGERDTRHVTPDGLAFHGHTGTWCRHRAPTPRRDPEER